MITTIIHYHPDIVILSEWWRQLIVGAMIWRGIWFHLNQFGLREVHGKVFLL